VKKEMPTGGSSTLKAVLASIGVPRASSITRWTLSRAKFQYLKKPRKPRFRTTVRSSISLRRSGRSSRSMARARKKSTVEEPKISGR
jgi:hypothetical protein